MGGVIVEQQADQHSVPVMRIERLKEADKFARAMPLGHHVMHEAAHQRSFTRTRTLGRRAEGGQRGPAPQGPEVMRHSSLQNPEPFCKPANRLAAKSLIELSPVGIEPTTPRLKVLGSTSPLPSASHRSPPQIVDSRRV